MTLFWVAAALLSMLAVAFLVVPLVRKRAAPGAGTSRDAAKLALFRDQSAELDADLAAGTIGREQWDAARADLQRGLLEDAAPAASATAAPARRSGALAIAVAAAVPLLAVSLYLLLGTPQGLDPAKVASAPEGAPHGLTGAQIEAMVAKLEQHLASNPDDVEGWTMLARTYSALGRFDDSAKAYAKAEARMPQNAELLADYADSLAMAQGQSLQGKPEELIRRALKADANNVKALALAGTVEFEKQNFAKAAEYWKRMLPLLPPDSEMGNSVRTSIKEAEDKAGLPGSSAALAQTETAAKAVPSAKSAAANAAHLSGTIKLAPALAARAAPDDTVFVLARPAQGSRMPLAAVRVKVKDLPLKFSFDDSMAMNPSNKLSDFSEVVVAARVSKSGNVMPQPGDLEGVSKPVHPNTSGMNVEIASEIK